MQGTPSSFLLDGVEGCHYYEPMRGAVAAARTKKLKRWHQVIITMIGRIGLAAVLWVFLGTGSAHATLLPPVTVGGTEWLQPLDFVNYTWNAISTVCDVTTGACNGSLGGNDLTGWTWADVDDLNALFNHYIGSPALGPGPSTISGDLGTDWVESMTADGFLSVIDVSELEYITGNLRTSFDATSTYLGRISTSRMLDGFGNILFEQSFAVTSSTFAKNALSSDTGVWFVRDPNAVSVPITDTLALVGAGLCALGFTNRKRAILEFSRPSYR